MNSELKPFWNLLLSFNWKFGIVLIAIICIPRFALVLHANQTGNYSMIGILMVVSALIPFVFLSKEGRKVSGLIKTNRWFWLFASFLVGLVAAWGLFLLGEALYGDSMKNWYVYIGKSYSIPEDILARDRKIMFLIMALTGMTFSPIGEEFFFRGIVHASFARSLGDKMASVIDSSAFAITHISHFGLVFINKEWHFYFGATTIWVFCMFLVSILFFIMKQRTRSIWGAVACHSGFNLAMIYCIFYGL